MPFFLAVAGPPSAAASQTQRRTSPQSPAGRTTRQRRTFFSSAMMPQPPALCTRSLVVQMLVPVLALALLLVLLLVLELVVVRSKASLLLHQPTWRHHAVLSLTLSSFRRALLAWPCCVFCLHPSAVSRLSLAASTTARTSSALGPRVVVVVDRSAVCCRQGVSGRSCAIRMSNG
jgi:hypothetical protein